MIVDEAVVRGSCSMIQLDIYQVVINEAAINKWIWEVVNDHGVLIKF